MVAYGPFEFTVTHLSYSQAANCKAAHGRLVKKAFLSINRIATQDFKNTLTLCIPRGVVFISYKMSIVYKNACQACSLLENPVKLYIFVKCIKNAFTSITEIMTHVKIMTSQ